MPGWSGFPAIPGLPVFFWKYRIMCRLFFPVYFPKCRRIPFLCSKSISMYRCLFLYGIHIQNTVFLLRYAVLIMLYHSSFYLFTLSPHKNSQGIPHQGSITASVSTKLIHIDPQLNASFSIFTENMNCKFRHFDIF